jgi:hypothetical protein
MVANGLLCDVELLRHLPVGVAQADLLQHLNLPLAEPSG